MYQHILVPVDDSTCGQRALGEAIRLAIEQGAKIRLVSVVEELPMLTEEAYLDTAGLPDILRRRGKDILNKAEDVVRQAGVTAESALLETFGQRVPRVIADEAKRCGTDLIVMGTHGRSGIDHLLLGSVAEGVIRLSPVPVLLVRGIAE